MVEEEGNEVIPPTFDAQAGFGFINRTLAYHQDISVPGLRGYSLPAGPTVVAGIVWYPMGAFTDGPLQNLVGMMPGLPKEARQAEVDESQLGRIEAIIRSMTPEERRNPTIINGSRRLRIARGSGTSTQDVNGMLKQFKMVQQMMRSMSKGKMPRLPVPGP